MNTQSFNFSAGPSMLPPAVMQKIQEELLNWHNVGASVMEISHRSADFIAAAKQATKDFRDLLNIPENYHILFLPGGSWTQYAAIPMNLLDDFKSVAYVQTGYWGKLAANEAARYAPLNLVANAETRKFTMIPAQDTWKDFSDAAYLHYVDNETIHGVEFNFIPATKNNVPLVCDMSSNILSRPFDVSKFGLIYACAQKNAGISGITIVIVRDDLLKRKKIETTPSIINYAKQVEKESMLNTPPTFPWYVAGLVFQWLKQQGGVAEIAKRNAEKAKKLYDYLDSQQYYVNPVSRDCRSRMNVIFKLPTPELDAQFVKESEKQGLIGLKGHRAIGGIRASIYNAMPMAGVEKLLALMKKFASVHVI
ncbi:MAG TPA: 3-phosphoserine/phosphohydroxythreonine transaminase [Coxiellaceae bacterium]|nr:3-phosphoserine/phosphohydroxythreonine transaminase [Coxiellaceae bacterium]